MSTTISDLRTRAALIANATQVGENTADRVGTAFDMVADLLESIEAGESIIPSVDISDIDTIGNYSDITNSTPAFFNVTKRLANADWRVGAMLVFVNQGRFIYYQVLFTDFEITNGVLDPSSSNNGNMQVVWRMYQTSGNPPEGYDLNEWTNWESLGGNGSVTIDDAPTESSTNAVSSGGVYDALQDITIPSIDVADLDTLNTYAVMTAQTPTFYNVTKSISNYDWHVGSMMVFINQARSMIYEVLFTDFVIEDGVLNPNSSINGEMKLVWRLYTISGNPPDGYNLNEWTHWEYLSGGGSDITIDSTPTSGSTNAVSSGGTYTALAGKVNTTGNETIAGNKTFSGVVLINGDFGRLQSGTDGELPDYLDENYQRLDDFDTTPTSGSTKPVTSGGIYNALGAKQDTLTFDNEPTDASTNPVTSDGIYQYLISLLSQYIPATNFATINGSSITQGGNIQIVSVEGTITIDAAPTSGSSNCAASGGIYDAIEGGYYA